MRVNAKDLPGWLKVIGRETNRPTTNWKKTGLIEFQIHLDTCGTKAPPMNFGIPAFQYLRRTFQDIVSNHPWIVETEHLLSLKNK